MSQTLNDRFSSCSDMREINEARVANILAYLDETVAAANNNTVSSSGLPLTDSVLYHDRTIEPLLSVASVESWPQVSGPKCPQTTYVGIKRKIETLMFEKEELQRDKAELQARLKSYRNMEEARREEMRADAKKEIDELKCEIATLRKKSSHRIALLTEEKEKLTQSIETVSSQLRAEIANRDQEKHKLESANAAAILALKSKWQAQERTAREKWRLAEAKRIKETTLQSLEPDIVLLLNRHKAEKARTREEFENELRQRDEVIAAKDASVEELKLKLKRDTEAALSREQAALQAHLQEETERLRRQLEEDRRIEKAKRDQMEIFFEEQKNTMQREITRLGREVLELKSILTTTQSSFHEAVAKEVARTTSHSNEILVNLKEKMMLEFSCREKEAAEQNVRYLHAKEEELRRKCEIERDTIITKELQKLEREHISMLSSARGTDELLRERYGQLNHENERLRIELELTREQLTASLAVKQKKEEEVEGMREACNLTEKRIKAIEDRIRSQYDVKISILDNAWQTKLNEVEVQHVNALCESQTRIDTLTRELHIERNRFDMEKKTMEQKHHVELAQINERILVTMTKKDSTIQMHAEQILALQEAIQVRDHELQRHELLLTT